MYPRDQGSVQVWEMAGLWSGCCLCVSVNIRGAATIIGKKIERNTVSLNTVFLGKYHQFLYSKFSLRWYQSYLYVGIQLVLILL